MLLYHKVPGEMLGSVLYPLNLLKNIFPNVYEKQVCKYQGRAELLRRVVPYLDCLWNDVVHLCPVHPSKIYGSLRQVGYGYPATSFFEIDSASLDQGKMAVMKYPVGTEERFYYHRPPDAFPGIDQLPAATAEYYKECRAKGTQPLLFAYVTHVLYKGSIDVGALPIIEA
jgi:hypothetical protein